MFLLTQLHSEQSKLHRVLAILSGIGLSLSEWDRVQFTEILKYRPTIFHTAYRHKLTLALQPPFSIPQLYKKNYDMSIPHCYLTTKCILQIDLLETHTYK